MSSPHGEIQHVSDTALMVAAARAFETESADGFVRDPFAARLAGERGLAILKGMPSPGMLRFGIGIRSRFMDELLLLTLEANRIETVVSLGCGLDARPWRLDLPEDLRWMEVDFADMLDYKDSVMAGELPHCRRERLIADANDPVQRRAVYSAAGAAPALLITEGLLMYLPATTVEALASEAWRESGIRHWMSDITTTDFSKAINRGDMMRPLRSVQAPDSLHGEEILDIAGRQGWVTGAQRSYIRDMAFAAERIQRMMAGRPRPELPPFAPDDPTGVHVFGHE
jgi:methyltransferase (TIGR00027 family)